MLNAQGHQQHVATARVNFISSMAKIKIEIGKVSCSIESQDKRLIKKQRNRFRRFLSSFGRKEEARAIVKKIPSLPANTENTYAVYIQNSFGLKRNFICRDIEKDFWIILLYLFAPVLVKKGGCVLHGACIGNRKNAFVFLGKSNSGKTTIATSSSNKFTIFHDDIVIIVKERRKYLVYACPVWKHHIGINRNFNAPLKGIFFLRKSKTNEIKPVTCKKTIIRKLLESNMLLTHTIFMHDQKLHQHYLDFSYELVQHARFYQLRFLPDYRFNNV